MKALERYTITAVLFVLTAVGVSWPFADEPARLSLLAAAGVALPVQVGTFALMVRSGIDTHRFMMWWGVGVLGRMLVVVAVGLALESLTAIDPTVLLLATCGFFFALLLLEPFFFPRGNESARFAQ